MKHPHPPRGGRSLILGIACLSLSGQVFAQDKDDIPRGTLAVDNTLVRVGNQTQLAWQIQYPEKLKDIIELSPTTITAKQELEMRVRLIGSKVRTNNGHGNNVDGVDSSNHAVIMKGTIYDPSAGVDDEKNGAVRDHPLEVVWSKNKSDWSRIFYGSRSTLVSTEIVLDTVIAANDVVDFGARGFLTNWLPLYCTSPGCENLLVLKNGDRAPAQISGKNYGMVAGFLKPFLSTDCKTVKIGETELLILVELDQTNPLAVDFDYQDLGMLVTFE